MFNHHVLALIKPVNGPEGFNETTTVDTEHLFLVYIDQMRAHQHRHHQDSELIVHPTIGWPAKNYYIL